MNAADAIKLGLETGEFVAMGYLQDLTDKELMERPHPACNHINWQVGHLVAAEHEMISQIAPGAMPPLPAGFKEKYTKEAASSDKPGDFARKDELLAVYKQQRAATLAALAKTAPADFDKPTGIEYAPTVASMYSLQGSHWLMHAGQWVIVRRKNGRPPLF